MDEFLYLYLENNKILLEKDCFDRMFLVKKLILEIINFLEKNLKTASEIELLKKIALTIKNAKFLTIQACVGTIFFV